MRSSEDSKLYRGALLSRDEKRKKFKVLFIDYGKVEILEMNALFELPPALRSFSPMAHKFSLVRPS